MFKRDVIEGYRNFRTKVWPKQKKLFKKLAKEGQAPQALVIACSDSRVNPSILLSADPGDIFVVRNVANIVPPFSNEAGHSSVGSALEYGVNVLGIPTLIVMGHAGCGGVAALLDTAEGKPAPTDFVGTWIATSEPARDKVVKDFKGKPKADKLKALEEENIRMGIANLMTYPWIKERVEAKSLQLLGTRFDIEKGELYRLTPAAGNFDPV